MNLAVRAPPTPTHWGHRLVLVLGCEPHTLCRLTAHFVLLLGMPVCRAGGLAWVCRAACCGLSRELIGTRDQTSGRYLQFAVHSSFNAYAV